MDRSPSIFLKIIAGEIPCWKLYEDAHVLAFLDIGPLSRGHCLVIPKQQYVTLDEMPPEEIAAIARVLPRLAKAVMAATGATAYNVLQNNGAVAGQEVNHVHFHIIPRAEGDGLGYRWHPKKLDAEEAKTLQANIAAALEA